MIRDRQPTVAEIIAELDSPTGDIGFCRNVRDGHFKSWVEPSEIYIDAIGTWLRCDGSHAGFALNGQRDFHPTSRNRIKASVDRWIKRRAQALDLLIMGIERNIDDNLKRHLDAHICCSGIDCGCMGATVGSYIVYQTKELSR